MIREICKDKTFLAQKAAPATAVALQKNKKQIENRTEK